MVGAVASSSDGECSQDERDNDNRLSADEETKLQFVINARESGAMGTDSPKLSIDNEEALKWRASRTQEQARFEREQTVRNIEALGATFRANGAVEEWFSHSDDET